MLRGIGDPDELVRAVEHAARDEEREVLERARRRAERIREEAREEAERIREEGRERAREEAEEEKRRRRSEAHSERLRRDLEAREELLERVWKRAQERLRSLVESEDDYLPVLERLARSAAAVLGPGRHSLAADEHGHRLLTEERLAEWEERAKEEGDQGIEFRRAADPVAAWGGLRVEAGDGRRRVEATFPARLALAREEMREAIVACLRGERS